MEPEHRDIEATEEGLETLISSESNRFKEESYPARSQSICFSDGIIERCMRIMKGANFSRKGKYSDSKVGLRSGNPRIGKVCSTNTHSQKGRCFLIVLAEGGGGGGNGGEGGGGGFNSLSIEKSGTYTYRSKGNKISLRKMYKHESILLRRSSVFDEERGGGGTATSGP